MTGENPLIKRHHYSCQVNEPVLRGSARKPSLSSGAEDMTTGLSITTMSFQGTTTVRLMG